MKQTNTSNLKIKQRQIQGGAQSKLQSLMSELYCVARQCSTCTALLLGSKTL